MAKHSTLDRIAHLEASQPPPRALPNRPAAIYALLSGDAVPGATDKERAAATRIHELLGHRNET